MKTEQQKNAGRDIFHNQTRIIQMENIHICMEQNTF